MPRILIVEDDPQISRSMTLNLSLSGFETNNAGSIAEAWAHLNQRHFDLICLDIGLPDGSGLDFCENLKGSGFTTPVLFISAITDEGSVVKGINCGAEDYLRKPFGMEELKARMNKIISKSAPQGSALTVGPLTVDPEKRTVKILGQVITLGRKETDILTLLAKKAGDVVSRESIITSVYEGSDLYDRTIDSHMSHLRRKIKEAAGDVVQIISVYGLGYRLQWRS